MKKFKGSTKESFPLNPLLVASLLWCSKLPNKEELEMYISDLKQGGGEDIEEFCEVKDQI
jgi:hypothetical protein